MNHMNVMRKIVVTAVAGVLVAGLGACREEERHRPLSYEKGVYNGPQGTALNEEQRKALRLRTRGQAGGGI
jgi:hypothetical protein